jgi:hypothetical protein
MKFLKKLFSGNTPEVAAVTEQEPTSFDDWATYKRYKGDEFWLITANRGLLKNNQLISMSWSSIEYRFLQRELVNGMFPRPDLLDLYYEFEDQLDEAIRKIGGGLAATQTGFGSRIVWYCAPNVVLEEIIRSSAQTFTRFAIEVSPASFKQFEQLLPTHLENQWAGNERILNKLAEHGDDGSEPREVMHWTYGSDPAAIAQLSARLEIEGYIIEELDEEKVRFSRLSSLSEDQSKSETTKLTELSEQYGCKYDGWETPIVKSTFH